MVCDCQRAVTFHIPAFLEVQKQLVESHSTLRWSSQCTASPISLNALHLLGSAACHECQRQNAVGLVGLRYEARLF